MLLKCWAEASVVVSKETGLEVNAEKTKYKSRTGLLWVITPRVMVIAWVRIYHSSLHNNLEKRSSRLLRGGNLKSRISTWSCLEIRMQDKNHSTKIDNSSFERVEQFKYLETILTNQNSILEEIRSRLKSGNACYHSLQNLLYSSFLSKNTKIKIYRTIILPVVLYGCETWSLTLREERRLRVSENMVLRLFGLKRDDLTGEWRRLYNEKLYDLYYLVDQIEKNMKGGAYVARMGDRRGAYMVLVGKTKGSRPHGRPMPRWEDNIQMNLQEVG